MCSRRPSTSRRRSASPRTTPASSRRWPSRAPAGLAPHRSSRSLPPPPPNRSRRRACSRAWRARTRACCCSTRRGAQGPPGPRRDRCRRGVPGGGVAGGGPHRQAARPRRVERARRRREAGAHPPHAAQRRRAVARRAGPLGPDGTARDHRAARGRRRTPLVGAAGMTAAPAGYGQALDLVTRVRGVRGAMLVSGDDGLVVAEQLMEGIKGAAVAALASSLAARLRRAMEAAGVGASLFWHLQCDQGGLLVVPAPSGVLIVAVAEPDVNVGLVRLELLRAAEAVG